MIKQLLLTSALFGLAICSTNALADQVLCDVSPTSTPQEMTPDFCGSQSVTSSRPYVSFQFEPSKPIEHVTWQFSTQLSGRWDCDPHRTECVFYDDGEDKPSFRDATACVKRVIYKDGTWKSMNECATAIYSLGPRF
ncbi:hypothetical protein EXT48_21355 [Pseudoalteromonas sp. CO348]|uniref:hypothetical protein n=1 Tax=Pseudoalteromonas TaxID=53246 RepID=UPI0010238D1E|nr:MULTISPECIES: hypothetical protein [Pseudoalteromonas]MCG9771047.1 hypothetical protein [Pseudoalteromonas piscicida]RZF98610.1 hypothetical protein EXT48_21355 [Pseudoalteromonas sp. CO348]